MTKPSIFFLAALLLSIPSFAQVMSSRMNEVFKKTDIVSAAGNLEGPWEVTYGPDDSLWITECSPSGGYKVRKVHPLNGGMRIILDLNTFSDAASSPTTKWRKAFTPGNTIASTSFKVPSYQGGLMGLAIHPDFATDPAKKFVYLAYGHDYVTPQSTSSVDPLVTTVYNGETVYGHVFRTWLVRFEYVNNTLQNPIAICDTIRGSNDHNSGRLIIRPEDGVNYLYYASGDMGAGQFDNKLRVNKAQMVNSYEGKILRFNLEPDLTEAQQLPTSYNRWIPNDNPYNTLLGVKSAVWATGMRNNQGFAYDTIGGVGRMYGTSHGPFSDDELNLLEKDKNYGHPLVIGYAADGNYDNAKAGTQASILPLIGSEVANAAAIPNYKDPVYSNYPAPAGNTTTPWTIQYIYTNQFNSAANGTAQGKNQFWASEGYSGLGLYSKSLIPGWKNSVLITALKWGRVLRMKLNASGTSIVPTNGSDTISYFQSQNRFRDIAISPDGKTLFVVMERSTTSSGPSAANPVVPSCLGCIHRYDFLGYNDNAGASMIPVSIPVAAGSANLCEQANSITINSDNNNLWVPITDSNSDIIAEIKANSQNLGLVTTSIYKNTNAVREDGNKKLYLDRNITITTQNEATSGNVSIRLYLSDAELTALKTANNSANVPSGVTGRANLGVFRSRDACSPVIVQAATSVPATLKAGFGGAAHVLTIDMPINSTTSKTSSFYFSNSTHIVLPTSLLAFAGNLNHNKVDLTWKSTNEMEIREFVIEKSLDGTAFTSIGTRQATHGQARTESYAFTDHEILNQNTAVLYYRLRMAGTDGSSEYSNVIAVTLGTEHGKLTVTPNPVSETASVSVTAHADGAAGWKLTDNAGRVVLQGRVELKKGNNYFPVNMKSLASGIYIFQVNGTGVQQQAKVQKL